MSGVAVLGESVADAFTTADTAGARLGFEVSAGGSPANTAAALARLGTRTHYVGRFSRGTLGRFLRRRLIDAGVDVSASVDGPQPSTLALTSLTDGVADYEFYAAGTADWQWDAAQTGMASRVSVDAVHSGSLALAIEPSATAIAQVLSAQRGHATITLDPNARPSLVSVQQYRQRFSDWVDLADIIKVSEADLDYMFDDRDHAKLCRSWVQAGVGLVVVTRGESGAHAFHGGEVYEVGTPSVAVVDTVGAGDAFTAGLLHGLDTHGCLGGRLEDLAPSTLTTALETATAVAAYSCTQAGAYAPSWNDLGR